MICRHLGYCTFILMFVAKQKSRTGYQNRNPPFRSGIHRNSLDFWHASQTRDVQRLCVRAWRRWQVTRRFCDGGSAKNRRRWWRTLCERASPPTTRRCRFISEVTCVRSHCSFSLVNYWFTLWRVKGKGSPYSTTERRVPELIPVLGSQPAGDVSHKLGSRLPLLSARPAVTPATLKKAATNFAAW